MVKDKTPAIAKHTVLKSNTHFSSKERTVWNFLIKKGFKPFQVAGIMGNLRQEHNFNTDDVAGGLGIAQWLDGRRAALLSRANPYSLATQLQFMVDEMKGSEFLAGNAIKNASTLEEATIAMQNLYERCGICMQEQRIMYAQGYLSKFN